MSTRNRKNRKATGLVRFENVARRHLGRAALIAAILSGLGTAASTMNATVTHAALTQPLWGLTQWATVHGLLPVWAVVLLAVSNLLVLAGAVQARMFSRLLHLMR